MYYLTDEETTQLATEIRKCKTSDEGYKKIDDFAKKVGCFDDSKESCFTMDFPNGEIYNAMQDIS